MPELVKQGLWRLEYFWRWAFTIICALFAAFAATSAGGPALNPLITVVAVAFQIWWAVGRLRNLGASGLLSGLLLIPIVNIIFLFYLFFAPGKPQVMAGRPLPDEPTVGG